MDNELTQAVLDYQKGLLSLERLRNRVILEVYSHLTRDRRKGGDEVSEFLLSFYDRVEGMLTRFRFQGLPFRHFLLRSVRWQWHTFRTQRAKKRRQLALAVETGLVGEPDGSGYLAEPPAQWEAVELAGVWKKRLVLLALKAAPWLEEQHLEALSDQTGADLAWLQACQQQLKGYHRPAKAPQAVNRRETK